MGIFFGKGKSQDSCNIDSGSVGEPDAGPQISMHKL